MSIFRSPERDAVLDRLLAADLGQETWRLSALRETVGDDADLLFPGGPVEMIEAWFDLGDRRMAEHAARIELDEVASLSARVRTLVLYRAELVLAHPVAMRRAVAILGLPGHAAAATRSLSRTVDATWRVAGDRSADFSWYTRRASLAAVHASTMLYALGEGRTADEIAEFLDRRLARVAAFGARRRRLFQAAGLG